MKRKKLAIDFDGTCVEKKTFPDFGESVPYAVTALRMLNAFGIELILWTCRDAQPLEDALKWFEDNKIQLSGINSDENCDLNQRSVKIDADYYIDDKALGCPLRENGSVDWLKVWELLVRMRYLVNEE